MCTIREVLAVGSKLLCKRFWDDNDNVVEYDEFRSHNDELLNNHGSIGTVSHSSTDYGSASE